MIDEEEHALEVYKSWLNVTLTSTLWTTQRTKKFFFNFQQWMLPMDRRRVSRLRLVAITLTTVDVVMSSIYLKFAENL